MLAGLVEYKAVFEGIVSQSPRPHSRLSCSLRLILSPCVASVLGFSEALVLSPSGSLRKQVREMP